VTMAGTWTHRDVNPAHTVELGLAVAKAHDWTNREAPRALQGLAIETAWLGTWFGGGRIVTSKAPDGTDLIQIAPNPTSPGERGQVARALFGSWDLLAFGTLQESDVETRATPQETGAWPLAIALIVVGVAHCAMLAYGAYQASQVVDRKLARDADAAKLTETHATTLEVLRAHAEREQKAGTTLPLDEPTRAALSQLLADQKALAQKQERPISSGAPEGSGSGVGFGFGTAAALAVAALVFLKE
jgi:hypothetical protein